MTTQRVDARTLDFDLDAASGIVSASVLGAAVWCVLILVCSELSRQVTASL